MHLATALELREEAHELAARRREAEGAPQDETENDELRVSLMTYDSALIKAARGENLAYVQKASLLSSQAESS